MTEPHKDEGSPAPAPGAAPDWGTPGPPATADVTTPRRRLDLIGWLLLILIVVIALVGTSPYWAPAIASLLPWSPSAGGDRLAAQLDEVTQRVDALAQHQSALDQQLARLGTQGGGEQPQAAVKDLAARIATLEQRPNAAGAPAELASLQDDLGKLWAMEALNEGRIAKLEARGTAAAGQRADEALLLALGQLRAQVEGSRPFATELGALDALARNRPEMRDALQPLHAGAAKGIPGMAVLTRRFAQEVVPAALQATAAPTSDGWGDYISAKLRSLVVIRRVGDNGKTASDPVEAAIARAEAALAGNDLAGAVKATESLPGPPAAPVQTWLADARERLAAEQALTKLTDSVTARLTDDTHAAASPPPASGKESPEH